MPSRGRIAIGTQKLSGDPSPKVRFAPDSLLEGNGFELPVPRAIRQGSGPRLRFGPPSMMVRPLNAIVNPGDAWRLEDQARRYHRTNEERYWRNCGAGLAQQRRERREPVPPRRGWHGYSTP